MSYTALYRKWRPQIFEDVKGQDHIVTTLRNQVSSGRIGHAYLFCGTRGTGKTSVAKIFARAVNCEHPVNGSPCGTCSSCQQIGAGNSLNVMEIDAASNNGVENIREIREQVQYPPTEGKYRVYIIDEVHMLSTGAFNALLKTLEEPPSYVIFILATTEVHRIPITVLSRCQRYDFRRITADTIAARLKELTDAERMPVEERALRYLAKAGDGSMRDALSLLDQCAAFHYGETLTYEHVLDVLGAVDNQVFRELFIAIRENHVTDCIRTLEELVAQGRELSQFVVDFIWYMRNLLLLKTAEDAEELLDMSEDNLKLLREDAALADENTLMRYIRVLSDLSGQMRYAAQKRVMVEIGLIKLCKPSMEQNLDSVLDRLRILEEKVENGIPMAPPTEERGKADLFGQEAKEPEVPEKKPEKAAPEDLQYIKNNWNMIVGQTSGMFKSFLSTAVPKYNGATGENRLYVEFTNDLAQGCAQDPEKKELLEQIIARQTGKSVEVEMVVRRLDAPRELAEISVDDILKKEVHMDVVVEEEPEDE